MGRFAFTLKLKDESVIPEYERLHIDIGDAVREAHSRAGYRNYSIFRSGLTLLGYYEADDPAGCLVRIESEPAMVDWWAKTNPLMGSENGKPSFRPIPEVFHMD
jgi:L-rhamnose mutarotase